MNSLIKYEPSYLSVLDDFDRMFESLFDGRLTGAARIPAVDIREDNEQYVLEAELTGLSEKDIDVKVQDSLLTISSKKEENKESKKSGYLVKERRSSSFARSFVIPKDVDREKIDASFKNGLLTLTLHKLPESKPRAIEIKAN